jgi:alkylation response protein AidB-like acyl-CoA dehydrogenase
MNLELSDDQVALQEMVRDFFDKESSVTVVRNAEPLGFDPTLWHKVTEMGLHAITVPEVAGGGGAGFLELAVAAEQVGRTLAPVPLIEAAVTSHLLAGLGAGPAAEALDQAVAGASLPTLALRPVAGRMARLVPAGAVADAVVVLDGDDLVLLRNPDVSPATPAASPPNLGALPLADRSLDEGDAVVLASGPQAVEAHRTAVHHWELLTAMSLVGLGDRALELGKEYVLERRAFGVLIGTFQTIQHRLADDVTALEGARLLAQQAAWATDTEQPNATELASMALLYAGETAFKTAAECLQFHGGYGYTMEYDIQLFFRRAKAWPLVLGDPRHRYAGLAHRRFDREGA